MRLVVLRRRVRAKHLILAKLGDGPGNGALDRSDGYPEGLRHLRLGHVVVVPEHDRGAHLPGQPVQGLPHDVLQVTVVCRVGRRLVGDLVGGVLVYSPLSPGRDVRVYHRATHVGIHGGHVADAVP
jgi:hypothetical protein